MPLNLKSLNALVTGGASGLGRAISLRLASEGVNVCINGLPCDDEAAAELSRHLQDTYAVNCSVALFDVSTVEGCTSVVEYTISSLGSIEIIISNAGWTRFKVWDDLDAFSEADWIHSFKINTLATLWLFKAAAPLWKTSFEKTQRAGVLLSTNSLAGLLPTGSSFPYSVTKAGQLRIIEGIAYHNGPWVRANAVCPGLMQTRFSSEYGEENMNTMIKCSPLNRPVNLEDCAEMFVSLCKNESITGKHITVDCGLVHVS